MVIVKLDTNQNVLWRTDMWCNHDHHQPEEGCTSEEKEMLERRSLIQGLAAGGLLTVGGSSLACLLYTSPSPRDS